VTRRRGVSLSYFGEAAFALRAGLRWPPRRCSSACDVVKCLVPGSFSAVPCNQGGSGPGRQQGEGEGGRSAQRNVGEGGGGGIWARRHGRCNHERRRSNLNRNLDGNRDDDDNGNGEQQLHARTHAVARAVYKGGRRLEYSPGKRGGHTRRRSTRGSLRCELALHALMQWWRTRGRDWRAGAGGR
jgi:hypothetical protein